MGGEAGREGKTKRPSFGNRHREIGQAAATAAAPSEREKAALPRRSLFPTLKRVRDKEVSTSASSAGVALSLHPLQPLSLHTLQPGRETEV